MFASLPCARSTSAATSPSPDDVVFFGSSLDQLRPARPRPWSVQPVSRSHHTTPPPARTHQSHPIPRTRSVFGAQLPITPHPSSLRRTSVRWSGGHASFLKCSQQVFRTKETAPSLGREATASLGRSLGRSDDRRRRSTRRCSSRFCCRPGPLGARYVNSSLTARE